MTHFRFRYKRVGYMRWRTRTAHRRAVLLALPLLPASGFAPSTASWRRAVPSYQLSQPSDAVLKIGDFVVSEAGDPQLLGHPGIRY
jgi:hypothetical protein